MKILDKCSFKNPIVLLCTVFYVTDNDNSNGFGGTSSMGPCQYSVKFVLNITETCEFTSKELKEHMPCGVRHLRPCLHEYDFEIS